MPKGDVKKGLLKAMIDLINESNPDGCWTSAELTRDLEKRGQWPPGVGKTRQKTVHMYLTENPAVFSRTYGAEYFLNPAYRKAPPARPR